MIINQSSLAALYKTYKVIFAESLAGAVNYYQRVAMDVPSTGRSNVYPWLGNFPAIREWLGDRQAQNLKAYAFEIVNKDFEGTIVTPRNDIEDDIYGVYTPVIQELGRAVKVHPDSLVFTLLKTAWTTVCYDGKMFCATDHPVAGASVSNSGGGASNPWFLIDGGKTFKPVIWQPRSAPKFVALQNATDESVFQRKEFKYGVDYRANCGFGLWQLAYGSKDTLTDAHFATAYSAMLGFKKENGEPIGIQPTLLVVGPANLSAAKTLIDAMTGAAGASNIWYKAVELLVVPWLV